MSKTFQPDISHGPACATALSQLPWWTAEAAPFAPGQGDDVESSHGDLNHRPNPIQEEASQCSRMNHHVMLVEEHRFDLYGVAFKEILGLITCRRCRFSHRTERHIR